MIANAFFVTTVIFLALGFFLVQECAFLVPWRSLLLHRYGREITVYGALLFCNLLAAVYTINRRFLLKDTGRKLEHIEKQLRGRESISRELTRRIASEK